MTTTATSVQLDIAPLSGTIGAEIRGSTSIARSTPDTLAAVRQALLDYKVIFFPGAHLNPEEHKEFAASFGQITVAHPVIPGLDEHRRSSRSTTRKPARSWAASASTTTTARTGTPT